MISNKASTSSTESLEYQGQRPTLLTGKKRAFVEILFGLEMGCPQLWAPQLHGSQRFSK